MPPASTSSIKPGDRFKEGIAVKVFSGPADLLRNGHARAYGEGAHVLLGRPAADNEQCPADHQEFTFEDGSRAFMHKDSAPHPVSWLHSA